MAGVRCKVRLEKWVWALVGIKKDLGAWFGRERAAVRETGGVEAGNACPRLASDSRELVSIFSQAEPVS